MRPSHRFSRRTWPVLLLGLTGSALGIVGTTASSPASDRGSAPSPPAQFERLPDGSWPAGTPAPLILGGALDPMIPLGDSPVGGSWPGVSPPLGPMTLADATTTQPIECADDSTAWSGEWSLIPPPARIFHSGAYDPIQRRLILFGGTDAMERNDVWCLSLKSHPRWRPLLPRGEPPAPRGHATMVYDPVRDRLIVFGGSNRPGVAGADLFGDVWELTLRGYPTWRRIVPAGAGPSPRRGATAIYDPVGDRMVIFGGLTGDVVWSGETWTLSLGDAEAWTRLDAPGMSPPARWSHSAIYDPVRRRMVVFGGNGISGIDNNDTYALSLDAAPAWTAIATAGILPPRRFRHSATYDPTSDRMIVFGGERGGPHHAFRDTWALTLSDVPEWLHLDVAMIPPGRLSHIAVYDAATERLVVHGGYGLLNDTWALDLVSPAWARLDPPLGSPHDRHRPSAIYDPVRQQVILFGTDYGVDDASFDFFGGGWALSLIPRPEWRPFAWVGRPRLCYNHPAFYDPVEDRMLVLRGRQQDMAEVWQVALSSETWSALTPAGPVPAAPGYITGVFDPPNRRIVVFGLGASMNESWALELEGGPRWVPLPAANPPAGRHFATTIYDSVRQRMVVFGGQANGLQRNDVWALTLSGLGTWTEITPLGVPPTGRTSPAAIYDPNQDRMIVYGGSPLYSQDDALWSLSFGEPARWTRLLPPGPRPVARDAHTCLYDPVRRRMLVSGGQGNLATWSLDLWPGNRPNADDMDEAEEADAIRVSRAAEGITGLAGGWTVDSAPRSTAGDAADRIAGTAGEGTLVRIPLTPRPTANEARRFAETGEPSMRVEPNPFTRSTRIELVLARSSGLVASVRDAQGRTLRELARGTLPAGRWQLEWDGRDAAGQALPTGLYFLSVDLPDRRLVQKTVLVD